MKKTELSTQNRKDLFNSFNSLNEAVIKTS